MTGSSATQSIPKTKKLRLELSVLLRALRRQSRESVLIIRDDFFREQLLLGNEEGQEYLVRSLSSPGCATALIHASPIAAIPLPSGFVRSRSKFIASGHLLAPSAATRPCESYG